MRSRVMLACTLLLLVAVPSFALPLCQECNYETNICETIPGAIERCRYDFATGLCYTTFERCSVPRAATVLTEWAVASVEISRPAPETETVKTAPAAAAAPAPAPPELK